MSINYFACGIIWKKICLKFKILKLTVIELVKEVGKKYFIKNFQEACIFVLIFFIPFIYIIYLLVKLITSELDALRFTITTIMGMKSS